MKLRYCALLLAALPLGTLAAEEPPRSDVNFTVVTEKEIPRDLLQATLYVRTEGNNLGMLNKQINEKVEGALNLLKTQPEVVLRSNNRDSQIRYNNQGKKMVGLLMRAWLWKVKTSKPLVSYLIN